jgi:hypothetical protein
MIVGVSVKEHRCTIEMLREALKQLVRAGFSPNPDASVMMSPNATGLQKVSINKIAKKFATPPGGRPHESAVRRYWDELKKKVEGHANLASKESTLEDYLLAIDEVEMKKLGNTDFAFDPHFQHGEKDMMASYCGLFGKLGFPLGHIEVQRMAQNCFRQILQKRVESGQIPHFVDCPENVRCEKTGEFGHLPVCGETWFRT